MNLPRGFGRHYECFFFWSHVIALPRDNATFSYILPTQTYSEKDNNLHLAGLNVTSISAHTSGKNLHLSFISQY